MLAVVSKYSDQPRQRDGNHQPGDEEDKSPMFFNIVSTKIKCTSPVRAERSIL